MDSHRRCLLICMILFYQKSNMDASIETNKTLTLTWPENETRVYLFTCNQQRPNTLSFVEEIHQRITHISWICLTFILTYRKEEIHFVLVKFGKEERNKYIIVQKTAISFYKYIFQAPSGPVPLISIRLCHISMCLSFQIRVFSPSPCSMREK